MVPPETVVRWHRQGFRRYWARKSRRQQGRPAIETELQDLIRRMSRANPLWSPPRIHGEPLKLGLTVSQATVSKYMLRHGRPPTQVWRTFLKNHAKDLIALEFLAVPTATFRVLFVLVVLATTETPCARPRLQRLSRCFALSSPPEDSAKLPPRTLPSSSARTPRARSGAGIVGHSA
jgi:hypothetical protein